MVPILPTAAVPVANGIVMMSWFSPWALTPLEWTIALATFTLGVGAIVMLRRLDDVARHMPERTADRPPPGEPDLPDAA